MGERAGETLTATERRKLKSLKRKAANAARARAITLSLLVALDATTTYAEPVTVRTPRAHKWRALYGSHYELVGDGLLGPDGKATGQKIVQKWSHQPGEIVESASRSHTGASARRYMVREDRSLRRI